MVCAALKAVFLWQAVDGGLGLAVARTSRGRGRETDQPLYVNSALKARTGKLGLERRSCTRERRITIQAPAGSSHPDAVHNIFFNTRRSSYLSDDQGAVLAGRQGLIALRVFYQHGLSRPRLPVAQLPAEATGTSEVCHSSESRAEKLRNTGLFNVARHGVTVLPTQPWSPRFPRWTPLQPPGPPPRRPPRLWCPSPRWRRSTR